MANATNHYSHYPDDTGVPVYLAYGFRPILLLLAPYIVLSTLLWALVYSGVMNPFGQYLLHWHIYEFLYGVGLAGILAFLLTGLPELFKGVVPVIGKKLLFFVLLWIAGRVSFWMIGILPLFVVGVINISLLIAAIAWAFKPLVLDPLQRHASLGYTLAVLLFLQVWYFLALGGVVSNDAMAILYLSLGTFMVLILLALRRVNMEVINELLENKDADEYFFAKPFHYNLAIFCIILYLIVEFFWPHNQVLGWLSLAAGAAVLGVLNDYKMQFASILFESYTLLLAAVPVLMSLGFFAIGVSILYYDASNLNHFRHILTSGAFGVAFYAVMHVITYVHTGRALAFPWHAKLGLLCILIGTFLRVSVAFYPQNAHFLYTSSALVWAAGFLLYFVFYYKWLLQKRVDGIKG